MGRYNYEEGVLEDVRQYLKENWEKGKRIEFEDRIKLHDDMFVSDSVTGNASGSYYCNAYASEDAVCHNLDLLGKALSEFCIDGNTLEEKMSGEWADVTIRCYVLGEVEGKAFDEWNEKIDKGDGDEDDTKGV